MCGGSLFPFFGRKRTRSRSALRLSDRFAASACASPARSITVVRRRRAATAERMYPQ